MAKFPEPSSAHIRINYLYHLAHQMCHIDEKLARFYLTQLLDVAEKNVVRLDPSLKRSICKGCKGILIPPTTCNLTTEGPLLVLTCLCCGRPKRFGLLETLKNSSIDIRAIDVVMSDP